MGQTAPGHKGKTGADRPRQKGRQQRSRKHACMCATPPHERKHKRNETTKVAAQHTPTSTTPRAAREKTKHRLEKTGPTSEGSAPNNFLRTHSHKSSDHESEEAMQSSYRRLSWHSECYKGERQGTKTAQPWCSQRVAFKKPSGQSNTGQSNEDS